MAITDSNRDHPTNGARASESQVAPGFHEGASSRYRRQTAFAALGKAGQAHLQAAKVAVVGVGALGSVIAERLVRAGVGQIRLIDRDWVEADNLPRQTLFTENDALLRLPKAFAASEHLRAINSMAVIEPVIADLVPSNAIEMLSGFDLIMDGTDNFETRYLINDVSLETKVPWVHGGCVGASGQVMVCVPGETACFRCLMPEPMPADQQATCDSAGVLGPAIAIVAGWQALEAIKILSNNRGAMLRSLLIVDLWENDVRQLKIEPSRLGASCPACQLGRREFLEGHRFSSTQVLCGRNAVQLHPGSGQPIDLERLASRLSQVGQVSANPYLLRFERLADAEFPFSITVFRDGRGIVAGTEDPTVARKLYATWIGQ